VVARAFSPCLFCTEKNTANQATDIACTFCYGTIKRVHQSRRKAGCHVDAREQKARELASNARITRGNGCWLVPSQSGSGARYKVEVDGLIPTCTCKDFELREKECKHILAVRLFIEQEKKAGDQPKPAGPQEPAPKAKRPTYKQDWPEYNASQTNEKRHFLDLLADLCRTIEEPERKPSKGRPKLRLADSTFAAIFKVYSTVSARRFACDLEEARERGHLSQAPHFNSVLNALEDKALTPILYDLIRLSSLPMKEIETDFAPDSSGFCTSKFVRWFDVKYGVTKEEAYWVKVHLMTGVRTNIVTAVEIEDRHAADSPQFPKLLNTTAQGFTIKEVSADNAYNSTDNLQAVEDIGGKLYSPFKKSNTGAIGGIFERAFHYFCLHREEFLEHYHKRSNVESTFSMIKRKFGDAIRSKTDTAMKNEALCKIVCHNICCLVSAMYELGLTPVFWQDEPGDSPDILPMIRKFS